MSGLILSMTPTELFLKEALLFYNRQPCTVISLTPEANQGLKQVGLPSQLLSANVEETWRERDSEFSELCMPGIFGDMVFPTTNLPVWKVLSIDRLLFWYGGKNSTTILDTINALEWDTLFTELNIGWHYPLAINSKERIAVQVHSVRAKEYYDALPYMTFDKIITDKEGEVPLLKRTEAEIILREGAKKTTESRSAQDFRRGLGFAPYKKVTGIVFDKRYEAEIRIFLNEYFSHRSDKVLVFTFDKRSEELYAKCLQSYLPSLRHMGNEATIACDLLYAFGWEPYLEGIDNLTLVDYYEKNMIKTISPEGVNIIEVS